MLLKYTQAQKRIKAAGKPQRTAGGMVKLSSGLVTVVPKLHRRVIKVASKRPIPLHRVPSVAVKREQIPLEACDNSNDSGLGFDHHQDYHASLASHSTLRFSDKEAPWHTEESPDEKRRRLEIKLESDDANDNFTFPETVRQQTPQRAAVCVPVRGRARVVLPQAPLTLSSQLPSVSRNGVTQITIACQPEQQHRARYQTEGSRGAVKDRTGNGFPIVKLVGYDRPATLQVFIGTDQGRVAPHMFYQACRVSGKNSTPCVEKKVDGTIVIEVDVEPAKDMVVTCDCVGILKERNVDVEHRFPEEGSSRSKKKSTRCRMVFRTTITNPDGSQETLQVTSQPIVCTQPPGVPEICKKSLSSCCVQGGQELFILGKNFLKDTRVVFQEGEAWSQSVQPDKEFLQQSHLVCVVPPYKALDISEPVTVRLVVESSGKASEPHAFVYLPAVLATDGPHTNSSVITQGSNPALFPAHLPSPQPLLLPSEATAPFMSTQTSPRKEDGVHPVMMWEKPVDMIMPPPSSLLPLPPRRSSVQMIIPDQIAPEDMKREVTDAVLDASTTQQSMVNGSDLSSTRPPSMDTFRRFVSNNSLPTINVTNYLSNIEGNMVSVPSHLGKDVPQIMIPSVSNPTFSCDSSNLLTTVNQAAPISFDSRNLAANSTASQSTQENLSVIVNSSMAQNKAENLIISDSQQHKQMPGQQPNVGLDLLVSNFIKKQAAEMTERRLDAFVNSAAESHISPNPEPPVSIANVVPERPVNHSISEMSVNDLSDTKTNVQSIMQSQTIPISTINEGSLCSLLNNSQQVTVNNQAVSSIQSTLDQLSNTSQTDMNSLMQSTPQVSTSPSQVFSASLEEQLSKQSASSTSPSQLNCTDINKLMHATPQDSESHAQQLANLQAKLNHQLSPRPVVISPNHSDLSNLVQTSQAANLHMSVEPKLSPHNQSSTQMNHSNFSSLMASTPQGTTNGTQVYTNLQASLEHLSSQAVNSTQMISHSESIQSRSPPINDVNSVMHSAPQTSAREAQVLSNLQATLEHQISSQIMRPVQQSHESLTSRNIVLNSSLPQTPEVQAAVNQAQALSNLQASIEHHLCSQVMEPPQAILEPMVQVSHSQTSLNPSPEMAQSAVNQAQALNSLHLSLGHLTSQVMTPSQQTHDSITNSIPLTTNSQIAVSQNQVISNLQATLEHHINSQLLETVPTSPQGIIESINNSLQSSPQHSPNQALTCIQVSLDQIPSQALSSSQPNCQESVVSNNLPLSSSQTINMINPMPLINSQTMTVASETSSISSTGILSSSPPSLQNGASILSPPGLSLNNAPTMTLSSDLAMHNSQQMEINASKVINASSTLASPELTLNDKAVHRLQQSEFQMQCPPSASFQQTGVGQYEPGSANITPSLPIQVAALARYEQCQELQERKEQYVAPQRVTTVVPPQTAPGQPVKKVEEGNLALPHELTQMSEHDLISYINTSCFDTV